MNKDKQTIKEEFKKINSLDNPKLRLDCDHSKSEWFDITRENIQFIIDEFKKIKTNLNLPTNSERKILFDKLKNNFNTFIEVENHQHYEHYFEHFLGVVPPLKNGNNFVVCGEMYSLNDISKEEYYIVFCSKNLINYASICTLSRFDEFMNFKNESSTRIWDIEENMILDLSNNRILMDISEETDDVTFPNKGSFSMLINKMDNEGTSAWLNRNSKYNKLLIDFGYCKIKRVNYYTSDAELIFEKPIECVVAILGGKPVMTLTQSIHGTFRHEYFFRNGSNRPAGFEITFEVDKLT